MQRQVVLLASSTESVISAWDLATCTHLTSYKGNASNKNSLCCLGQDYLVSAQNSKDALQFWTWHKDQVLQRSFVLERMTAVAATSDGAYVAAGSASGSIYIWEVASGRLLRVWAAHYKGVTALAFHAGCTFLVSGGEDTLVNVWMVSELLDADAARDPSAPSYSRPAALHSWSDHTLPVTALHVGSSGAESAAVVASASLDRSVKLHRLSDGALLAVALLPAAVTSLAVDAGEHALYAGGADGVIYEVGLVGGEEASGGAAEAGGAGAAAAGAAAAGAAGAGGALGAGVMGLRPHARLVGHSKAVNSLSMTLDGEQMVSGSDDGTAHVWDLRSRQPVHVIQSPGKVPVTSVLALAQPPFLSAAGASGGAAGGSSSGRVGPKRPQPLAPFTKYPGLPGSLKPWEGAPVVLDGSASYQGIGVTSGLSGAATGLFASDAADLCSSSGLQQLPWLVGGVDASASAGQQQQHSSSNGASQPAARPAAVQPAAVGGGRDQQQELDKLRLELQQAQAAAQQWKALHAQLHEFCVGQVVGSNGL